MIAFRHDGRGVPRVPVSLVPSVRGRLLFLPLCPSTNGRQRPRLWGHTARMFTTAPAKQYMETVGAWLRAWVHNSGFVPIPRQTRIPYWVVMTSVLQDPSNFSKILWDTLQKGGVLVNDRYVLQDNRGACVDPACAGITVELPYPAPREGVI